MPDGLFMAPIVFLTGLDGVAIDVFSRAVFKGNVDFLLGGLIEDNVLDFSGLSFDAALPVLEGVPPIVGFDAVLNLDV